MTTVFIAGSIALSRMHPFVVERIQNMIDGGLDIVVGDAKGVDTSIQEILVERHAKSVTIYCSGGKPRNNVGGWPVRFVETYASTKSRAFYTAKDLEMARNADFGFMIWDTKSTGTLSNIIELLVLGKKALIFISKTQTFLKVDDVDSLETAIKSMSKVARNKAETKIKLSEKVARIRDDLIAIRESLTAVSSAA